MKINLKGFTLIELLVVIAIIAILAAILFPVFAQAREKARASSCLSNTKQLATATQLYADDYDETLPGVKSWEIGGGGAMGYMQTNVPWTPSCALYPYVKNVSIFCCPSAPNKLDIVTIRNYPTESAASGGPNPATGSSYCFNGLAYNFTSLAEVGNPSALIFCMEMNKARNWNGAGSYPSTTYIMPTPNTMGGKASTFIQCGVLAKWNKQEPHNGGQNICFCDGHAKYHKTGTLTWRNLGCQPNSGETLDTLIPHSSDDNANYNAGFMTVRAAQYN